MVSMARRSLPSCSSSSSRLLRTSTRFSRSRCSGAVSIIADGLLDPPPELLSWHSLFSSKSPTAINPSLSSLLLHSLPLAGSLVLLPLLLLLLLLLLLSLLPPLAASDDREDGGGGGGSLKALVDAMAAADARTRERVRSSSSRCHP